MARKKPSSRAKAPAKKTPKANEEKVEAAAAAEESSDKPVEADAQEDVVGSKPSSKEAAAVTRGETGNAADDAGEAPEQGAADTADEDDITSGEDAPSEGEAATPDKKPDPIAHTPPPVATEQVIIRKGGFVPLVLGGLVAAAIGFGAAYYGLPRDDSTLADFQTSTTKALDDQSASLAGLSDRVDGLSEGPDLSGIETAQADMGAAINSLSDRVNTIETQLSELGAQLTDLATRPLTEGASEAAVAAYEQELKKLQDAMAVQRAEIEAMAADARAMEDNAQETAQATMRRAAVTRIQTALENGTGFAAALTDLDAAGIIAPDALTRVAQDGVASLADLQDSFPDAARAALATSREAASENGESGGFSAFLRNQLGARSLEPRAGNDPDAVLSRAEAAVRDGRLTDALAEIEALPEVGRAELSDWSGDVARRLEALAAAQTLGENLN